MLQLRGERNPGSRRPNLLGATRHYPYVEIDPAQNRNFGDPMRPARDRPGFAAWLENVLLEAVARDVPDRFEAAEKCFLPWSAARLLQSLSASVLVKRNTMLGRQSVALVSIVMNLVLHFRIAASG